MKVLILGGTVFLGRHLVDAALAHGHEVTLFNRGMHDVGGYSGLERLRGDRAGGDLDALRGRRWDVAIDTSGYVPRLVQASAALLADAVEHYTFVSTISAYPEYPAGGVDEQAPVASPELGTEEVTGETYGPLKVACELAAEAAMPGRVLVVRPVLIVGPHDNTNRFTYWPVRVAQGGEVLAPGRPERAIQLIDGRDLAEWMVRLAERRATGLYNATGPEGTLTMGALLEECRRFGGGDARFTWVGDDRLLAIGAGAWMEVPLWVPTGEAPGFFSIDCRKAVAAGLTFRPLIETIRATLAWYNGLPLDERPGEAGMSRQREEELLLAAI